MTLDELRSRVTCTVEEAAAALDISRSSAYEAVKRGQIPTIRIGRRLRVSVPALLAMLGAHDEAPAAEGPGLEVLDGGGRPRDGGDSAES